MRYLARRRAQGFYDWALTRLLGDRCRYGNEPLKAGIRVATTFAGETVMRWRGWECVNEGVMLGMPGVGFGVGGVVGCKIEVGIEGRWIALGKMQCWLGAGRVCHGCR